jgi:hypothetical protein
MRLTPGQTGRLTVGRKLTSTSKLGGPGSRIHILQEQAGPAVPPGTGFPFRHLRWRYPNPPPHVHCLKTAVDSPEMASALSALETPLPTIPFVLRVIL